MQALFTNLFTNEFISKTSLISFPQAKRAPGILLRRKIPDKPTVGRPEVGALSIGAAGMTKLELACGFTTDWITNSIVFLFMQFGS